MLQSMKDEPGTQREYETIFVVRPDASSEQIGAVNTRIRKVIDDASGKLLRVENWGKRKLAYEIKKQSKGIYLYWRYLAGSPMVAEIERNLRMLDTVLRYLTVKIDEDVDPEARPSEVTDVTFDAAAETRPDEEDYYLGRTAASGQDEGEAGGEQSAEQAGQAGADSERREAAAGEAAAEESGQAVEAADATEAAGDDAEPAKADETSEPAKADETSEPAKVDETSEPAEVDETTEPAEVDETTEPAEAAGEKE